MDMGTFMKRIVGTWSGSSRLWVSPGEPARDSETTAAIELVGNGAFATIRYTWAEGGRGQDGLIIARLAAEPDATDLVWLDSWHMGDKLMLCRRESVSEGRIAVRGSYAAPPGPDWGWRIVLESGSADRFRILMDNITPDGQEAPAVEAEYTRST